MFRDETRSEARGFLENVTGLPFVGYSVSGDLTVVNVAEREAELLASKVFVERPTIMISLKVEQSAARSMIGKLRARQSAARERRRPNH